MSAETSLKETSAPECRRQSRYQVAKQGRILTGFSSQGIIVEIDNLSLSGAGLRLPSSERIRPAFRLLFVAEQLVYPCRICWRRGNRAGVQFTAEPYRLRAGNL